MHLPVDGRTVRLRPLAGADELAIAEAQGSPLETALVLLQRLASPADDGADDWSALSVTDFELLLLAFRRGLFGDLVRSDFFCPQDGCGERVEIEFSLADFVAGVTPGRPRGVSDDPDRPGWRRLGEAAFRPPAVRDQVMAQAGGGADLLARRCIEPPNPPARLKLRCVSAMEAIAPEVSQTLEGVCPGCGAPVRAVFHVPAFVVAEVQRAFGRITEEVDLIARAYHWSEAEILSLPRRRRQDYAARIRDRGLAA
ncbi:hypothetical protein QO010_002191 [Caulobacter ginsengisoli]|uniref:Phage tail protein n=1 Tax=Caulobacter ginsengisoli TaxID=400775 RepID=A0ABU0IQW3_9CAUL|nr:hypothetical protein [Caulobacter ginsengisoli]MDQ0464410.1 hypothetical protein [Caulobacter ginsengisoli]